MGLVKSQWSMFFFQCASYDSQRLHLLDCLKKVLPPDAFEAFLRASVLDRTAFCLGEEQDMLGNNECSSWYGRVGDFWYRCGIGENNYCSLTDQHAWPDETSPLLRSD